jgi:hypothetical protein
VLFSSFSYSCCFCSSIYSVLAAEFTPSGFGLGFGLQYVSSIVEDERTYAVGSGDAKSRRRRNE